MSRMTAVTDPDLCKRVALRYSLGCIGICSVVAPALDLTTMAFAVVRQSFSLSKNYVLS